MRSKRAERLRRGLGAIALAIAATCAGAEPVAASASAPAPAASSARAVAIEQSVQRLRADHLLGTTHKTHRLRWNDDDDAPEKPGAWMDWLLAFAQFLNDASRFVVWFLGVAGVALLAVVARRLVQLRAFRRGAARPSAVSHVRDLDVRPESLPDDIGATARALWQAGDVAAALSLLYRGALSRLIHRHAVPIAASTTEGECLALAQGSVDAGAHRYLTQLVRAREAGTYGRQALSDAMGDSLCTGFATRLEAPPAAEAAR